MLGNLQPKSDKNPTQGQHDHDKRSPGGQKATKKIFSGLLPGKNKKDVDSPKSNKELSALIFAANNFNNTQKIHDMVPVRISNRQKEPNHPRKRSDLSQGSQLVQKVTEDPVPKRMIENPTNPPTPKHEYDFQALDDRDQEVDILFDLEPPFFCYIQGSGESVLAQTDTQSEILEEEEEKENKTKSPKKRARRKDMNKQVFRRIAEAKRTSKLSRAKKDLESGLKSDSKRWKKNFEGVASIEKGFNNKLPELCCIDEEDEMELERMEDLYEQINQLKNKTTN